MSGSKIPAWERHERIGATLWEQGRLLPAWAWLTAHRRRLKPGAERLRLLETEGRVVVRMLETPELRWLGRRLAPGIVDLLDGTGRGVGLHMYQRATDVATRIHRALGRDSLPTARPHEGEDWFLEAGDLTAVLAYRHARYRRTFSDEVSHHGLAIRYLTQERDKDLVGSSGIRTRQLPGAERVWTLRQHILALFEVQYGWWHRIRLAVRLLRDRSRRRPTP